MRRTGWMAEALVGAAAGVALCCAAAAAPAPAGALPAALPPPAVAVDGVGSRAAPFLAAAAALGRNTAVVAGDSAWSGGDGCPNLGGLFCPAGGVVWVTADGGTTWVRHDVGGGELSAVAAAGPGAAYAWGPRALVASTDGGRDWRSVPVPGPGTLVEVSFASPEDGWAVLQGACEAPSICSADLFATSNGGRAWREIARSGPQPGPGAVASVPGLSGGVIDDLGAGRGWVAGQAGTAWWTDDGGRSWQRVAGALPLLQAVVPGRSGAAWGLGEPQAGSPATPLLRSDDGWRTWTVAGTIPAGATSLAAAGGSLWALGAPLAGLGGDAAVLRSTDGGRTWSSRAADGLAFYALAALGSGRAVAVAAGPDGVLHVVVTADGGRTWRPAGVPGPGVATPGPVGGMGFWNGRDGWGVGTAADLDAVLFTRDGGRTWHRAGSLPGHVLAATFSDPRDGLAAGTPALRGMGWAATADGGRRWSALPLSAPALAFSLSAPAPGTFTAAVQESGGAVRVAVTADGGASWSLEPAPAGTSRLAFGTPRCGWAVAGANVLWRTTDGGASWAEVLPLGGGAPWQAPLLAASGCRGVWLVSGTARRWTVWHSADAGRSWRARALPPVISDAFLSGDSLAAAGRDEAWLLSRTGLWRTEDGGASWLRVAVP